MSDIVERLRPEQESILSLLEGSSLAAEWIKAHLDYEDEKWCLIWPFSRNQGGYANYGERGLIVSRIMCEWRNGKAPEGKPEAAHECGKGRSGCVNPCHVVWKSHSENLEDVYKHGRVRRYTLTPEQVDEIRTLEGRMRLRDIAEKFGVTDTNIRQIFQGRIWKSPHPAQRFYTEDELERIRKAPGGRGRNTVEMLAKEFGVSTTAIYRIRKGKSFRPMNGIPPVAPQDSRLSPSSPDASARAQRPRE